MRANLALAFFTETDKRLMRYVRPHRINELSETWLQSMRLKGLAIARTLAILNVIFVCEIVLILTYFFFRLDVLTSATVNITVVLLSWLLQIVIWRTKLRKLQTIVAPSLSESASEEFHHLDANTNPSVLHPSSVNHSSQKKPVVKKKAKVD
jgi:ABC-type transport system involved in Fe-S cluster assembly fused permease/ATPase subunit